jgi:5'-nucleotidase
MSTRHTISALTLSTMALAAACDLSTAARSTSQGAGGDGGDGGTAASGGNYVAPQTVDVRLIAINDFHGRIEPDTNISVGGAVYLAQQIQMRAQEQPNTLVVTAGDMIGGSKFFSGILYDEPTIAFMNTIGVDVAGVGNHEFDRPFAELKRLHEGGCHTDGCVLGNSWDGANFPLLGANVHGEGGTPLLPTHHLIEVDGAKIGFIGATTARTADMVFPPFIDGITFAPVGVSVNAAVPALQAQGAETIVLLLHQGGGCTADVLDDLDPAIDVVVMGHSHELYACDGPPVVVQGSGLGERFSVIDLSIEVPTQRLLSATGANAAASRGDGADPAVEALLATYAPLVSAAGDQVVGTISESISDVQGLAKQVAAGLLVADAFLEATSGDAVVAFTNNGGVRDGFWFPKSGAETSDGQVTYAEIFNVTPFSNSIVTMTLTGAQIEAVLEQQFTDAGGGNRLQPSASIHYAYDPNGTLGDWIDPADITINNVAIDLNADYRVTVNSFIGAGGGFYTVFTQGTNLSFGLLDRDVVASYITANAPVASPALDRVTVK